MRTVLLLSLLPALILSPISAFAADTNAKQADPASIRWFEDAKFGLFVHWGVYSVLGNGEWVMQNTKITAKDYEKIPPKFNPVKFDAAEWVSMVKDAGMKYITITSKHHDGFAMYDSKVSDYDIVDRTPYKKDVLKLLADECRKQGIKLFFYYSPLDWHHGDYYPRGRTGQHSARPNSGDWDAYKKYYMAQVDELCSGRYGKIGGIWFDGIWDKPKADWSMLECYNRIHAAQPQALVGNNHHVKPLPGEDFQMFEQDLPGHNKAGFNKAGVARMPLETCLTMNGTWGYSKTDKNFKSTKTCLHYLIRAAGAGANLLLNVGPKPDGTIQPEFVARLAEMGKWLRKNGKSIYGTRKGPYSPSDWGVSTIKGDDTVYLHILKVPADDKLTLAAPPDGIQGVTTLSGKKLDGVTVDAKNLVIPIPENIRDEIDTLLVLKLGKWIDSNPRPAIRKR
ncbi:MAG: alpha-L-fucosidase [Planctomycetota bacterium]|nr:alpha-L-fucosidase [Planctomycetota bacterium]